MNTNFFHKLLGIVAALLSLVIAGTAMAGDPSGVAAKQAGVPVLTGTVKKHGSNLNCQRRNFEDHLAVCCAYARGGKSYFKQLARKDCRRLRGAEVAKSRCPARHGRSDDPKRALVCCQFDDTPGFGVRAVLLGGKVVWYGLTSADRCTGSNKPVKRSHCVKRTTRRERMIACNKRKGWVWKNNRCQREAVRDKRDPRQLECRKRGRGWAWRDGKCQRAYVRDKRDR